MSTVDRVIYDALAKRQNVVLPGVGTLEVKTRRAKKISEDRIIPPQNVVAFNPNEVAEAETVIYLLTSTGGANEEEARTLYASWLEGARTSNGVNIKEVGEIRDGKFVVAQPLHLALNPTGEEQPIVMKKEKKGTPMWIWIVLGIVLAAIALILLSYFGNGFLGIQKQPKQVEIVAPVVEVQPVVEEPAPVVQPVPVEPAFHVIAGSFAREANADSYVKELGKQFPELSVQKIKNARNGNWLVSIFNAPTERQAYNKMNSYWDIDLDLWVYEQK